MIEVIKAGMFAGKTTLLIKKIKEAKKVGVFKVLAFKPVIDNRYGDEKIVSHDGEEVDAIPCYHSMNILKTIKDTKLEYPQHKIMVFIDEVQFFDSAIVTAIRNISMDGADVVVAGLDMDSEGRPFGYTGNIMAISTNIIELTAKCKCGRDSYVTLYKKGRKSTVKVGNEGYEPVCMGCFYAEKEKHFIDPL